MAFTSTWKRRGIALIKHSDNNYENKNNSKRRPPLLRTKKYCRDTKHLWEDPRNESIDEKQWIERIEFFICQAKWVMLRTRQWGRKVLVLSQIKFHAENRTCEYTSSGKSDWSIDAKHKRRRLSSWRCASLLEGNIVSFGTITVPSLGTNPLAALVGEGKNC